MKTRRQLLILLSIILTHLLCPESISALTRRPYDTLAAGNIILDTISSPIDELRYHLRIIPERNVKVKYSLFWNYNDSGNHRRVDIELPEAAQSDGDYASEIKYRIITRRHNQDSTLTRGIIRSGNKNTDDIAYSVILRSSDTGSILEIGAARTEKNIPVKFDNNHPSKIGIRALTDLKIAQRTIRYTKHSSATYSSHQSIDSLRAHIVQSGDSIEGCWTYLDRDTDPLQVQLGGHYTFATVFNNDHYDIIYLSGATTAKEDWQTMRIKGHLYPTIFKDHFDLIWIDTAGKIIDNESNAAISPDKSILTLHFPLLNNATLRFKRISPSR